MATIVLDTPFHLITPLGLSEAFFYTEAGKDGVEWGCFQKDTGEFWIWPNRLVRLQKSVTEYRSVVTPFIMSEEYRARLAPHMARAEKARAEAANNHRKPVNAHISTG
jgi:hypothetical protein